MAVTAIQANHLIDGARAQPADDGGKLRTITATIAQGAAAGDAGSTWDIAKLPPGKIKVLPHLCRYRVDALGASRTMNVGNRAYMSRGDQAMTNEAVQDNAYINALDVSGATNANFPVTAGMTWDMWSTQGVMVFATINGGTIPAGATAEFIIVYVDMN